MIIDKELFGIFTDPETEEECKVYKYKLKESREGEMPMEVHVLSYGASLCGVLVPDGSGGTDNVVLGFDHMKDYVRHGYQGSTIGRFANRIKDGKFTLNGQQHQLTINNNGHCLHGGTRGWDKRVWEDRVEDGKVVFSLTSEDGDQGFPGRVMVQVSYELLVGGQLQVHMRVVGDTATPINMTNHAFFNLAGHGGGREELLKHVCQFECDRYLPVSQQLIPTGEQRSVENTAFDLRVAKGVGSALAEVEGGGFDHCFVLQDTSRGTLRPAASFKHPPSGRSLEISTTEPGVQFYTGNFMPELQGEMVGRGGVSYTKQGAFACEPQNFPDAVNHESFPDSILQPGKPYLHTILYKFSCTSAAQ
uniref:Aldose 1-epimerase n=1 Tax=Hirondellea gigas TaxID=1518452 RepID=A0A2P2IEJ8_9CRUS